MVESDWRQLFSNVLDLRNKVFQCVSTARCFEVSIVRSINIDNVIQYC